MEVSLFKLFFVGMCGDVAPVACPLSSTPASTCAAAVLTPPSTRAAASAVLRRPLPLMPNPAMVTSDPVVAAVNPSLNTANIMVPTEIMDLTRLEGKLGREGASPPPSLSPHGFPASAVAATRLWRGGRGGGGAGLGFRP
jgi:hypothetical protein